MAANAWMKRDVFWPVQPPVGPTDRARCLPEEKVLLELTECRCQPVLGVVSRKGIRLAVAAQRARRGLLALKQPLLLGLALRGKARNARMAWDAQPPDRPRGYTNIFAELCDPPCSTSACQAGQ